MDKPYEVYFGNMNMEEVIMHAGFEVTGHFLNNDGKLSRKEIWLMKETAWLLNEMVKISLTGSKERFDILKRTYESSLED